MALTHTEIVTLRVALQAWFKDNLNHYVINEECEPFVKLHKRLTGAKERIKYQQFEYDRKHNQ